MRAIRGRGRIDRDLVDPAFGQAVIEATRAAGHAQRLGPSAVKACWDRLRGARGGRGLVPRTMPSAARERARRVRGLRLGLGSIRARHACVLRRSTDDPVGMEVAGRVRKPVAPVGLGRAEILFVAACAPGMNFASAACSAVIAEVDDDWPWSSATAIAINAAVTRVTTETILFRLMFSSPLARPRVPFPVRYQLLYQAQVAQPSVVRCSTQGVFAGYFSA